jgi:hypothetical protein
MNELTSILWGPGIGITFCIMLWASFKSKHNRVVASLAVLCLGLSVSLFNFVPNIAEHGILKWVCFGFLLAFFLIAIGWILLDLIPLYRRVKVLFNK